MIIDYLNDRITMSLEEFIIQFLKRWKMVAIIVVICAGLFMGVSYTFGEEISAPASEEYLYWEKNLENVLKYRENSILMQVDPLKIYEETVFLQNYTEKEVLKSYVFSTGIWDNLETERSKLYISELLGWTESEETDTVVLSLRHATEEECKSWMMYLKQQVMQFDKSIQITDGSSKIVTDETVLERQQKKYKDIDYAEHLLEESQAAYTIEVKMEVAALVGTAMGLIFACLIVAVGMIFKKNSRR